MPENMEQEFFYWPKSKTVLEIGYDEIDGILNSYYGPSYLSEEFDLEAISWVASMESHNDSYDNIDLPYGWDEEEDFKEIDE